jgi:hypothetical protein
MMFWLLVAACGEAGPNGPKGGDFPSPPLDFSDAGPGTVSYNADVAPIFRNHCLSCHYSGSRLDLDLQNPFDPEHGIINRPNTYTKARNSVVVVPGRPEESALIDKVSATDLDHDTEGDPMPFATPYLTADERKAIETWIDEGANDDDTFGPVAAIFGDGVSLGRKAGKCSYCHNAASVYKPDLSHPFDPKTGVKNVAANVGGLRVKPGDAANSVLYRKVAASVPAELGSRMPLNYPKLTADEIETVRTWIREGARNN